MENFPYKYYYYGSVDSLDKDVLIQISKDEIPINQEDRKIFLKNIEIKYNLDFNANLIVVEDGIVIDTIYPKTWIDSINNSFYNTYKFHDQLFELPINRLVKRNKLLAIYKTVRTILSSLSRTKYRSMVKPILKGCHDFNLKIGVLDKIDFTDIDEFNQTNWNDIDIWKSLAFYIGQNISLIKHGFEIYDKKSLVYCYPDLYDFIYRKGFDKNLLNKYLKEEIDMIKNFGVFTSNNGILICNDEKIDMLNEKYI